jgi:DNA-binding MarR family transcriptional regulator
MLEAFGPGALLADTKSVHVPGEKRIGKASPAAEFEAHRRRNLRILLFRSTRIINARVTEELQRRGYADVRPGHGTLLANLDFDGNSVTEIADRAQISTQAAGKLALELERLGYITREADRRDKRALTLRFTAAGRRLVRATVEVVDEIEAEVSRGVGGRRFEAALAVLRGIVYGRERET